MSISSLATYANQSPNCNARKNSTYNPDGKVKKITLHHVAGVSTAKSVVDYMAIEANQKSANYAIGNDGGIACGLDEDKRAWTSNSRTNDYLAVTVELSNSSTGDQWPISDVVLNLAIKLCVDVCKRWEISSLTYTGKSDGTLTTHDMFYNTVCPGPYLKSKLSYICEQVNKELDSTGSIDETLYRVQVGAYQHKENADAIESKLKAKGYDTYMVIADYLFKVQTGAYSKKENADAMAAKLKASGFDTYITTKSGTAVSSGTTSANAIVVGSKVKVASGAKTYDGASLANFVYNTTYDVIQMEGNRVVIGLGKAVTAAINMADLIKV